MKPKFISGLLLLLLIAPKAYSACTDEFEYLGNNDIYQVEFGARAPGVFPLYGIHVENGSVVLPSCPIESVETNKVVVPVLLVDFSDFNPITDLSNPNNPESTMPNYVKSSREEIHEFLNGATGPAQYYKDVSGGKFNIEFDVIDWISTNDTNSYLKNRADYFYQRSNSDTWYCDRDEVMRDVIKSAVSVHGVNFADYDTNSDEHSNINKIADGAILMYEGGSGLCNGTNMSYLVGSSLTPEDSVTGSHAVDYTRIAEMVEIDDPNFSHFSDQNTLMNFYVNLPESSASTKGDSLDVGGIVHELGHLFLGFEDYYYNSNNVRGWALSGAIGRNASHPSAWEKWIFGGWISPLEVSNSGTFTLDATDIPDGESLDGDYLIKIPLNEADNKYITVEYRWLEN